MESKIQQPQIQKTKSRKFLYVIAIVIVLYGAFKMLSHESKSVKEIKATIDSLNKANAILIEHQKQIDSAISADRARAEELDAKIHNIKEKTTVIKEYYHEISNKVANYDAVQVDSFFKSRYNY